LVDYQNLDLGNSVAFDDFDSTPSFPFDSAVYIAAVQGTRDALAAHFVTHGQEPADIASLDVLLNVGPLRLSTLRLFVFSRVPAGFANIRICYWHTANYH
jgi:hypothetical protein